eukprot:3396782-Rhodomonas_salina.1
MNVMSAVISSCRASPRLTLSLAAAPARTRDQTMRARGVQTQRKQQQQPEREPARGEPLTLRMTAVSSQYLHAPHMSEPDLVRAEAARVGGRNDQHRTSYGKNRKPAAPAQIHQDQRRRGRDKPGA